jgi:hypothetical protein
MERHKEGGGGQWHLELELRHIKANKRQPIWPIENMQRGVIHT